MYASPANAPSKINTNCILNNPKTVRDYQELAGYKDNTNSMTIPANRGEVIIDQAYDWVQDNPATGILHRATYGRVGNNSRITAYFFLLFDLLCNQKVVSNYIF